MISKQEPRVLIVDGENLVQSPHLKEVDEVEKEDVKKKLPTILDIVLRPELFDNATYLSEGVDGRKRIISNEIKDEEDYYDDADDEDYVIATLDELYNEVEEIYDELYDNAEPVKPQDIVKGKSTSKPTILEPSGEKEKSKSGEDSVLFPSSKATDDTSNLDNLESEEKEFHEGSGAAEGDDDIEAQTDSTRIEFPRTLDIMQDDIENDVDYDYPVMDIPMSNALKGAVSSKVLSPHNRLFPMPSPTSQIEIDEMNIQKIAPRNNLRANDPDSDERKCYCPCKCTEEHSGPTSENNVITTESSRTSAHTTG